MAQQAAAGVRPAGGAPASMQMQMHFNTLMQHQMQQMQQMHMLQTANSGRVPSPGVSQSDNVVSGPG